MPSHAQARRHTRTHWALFTKNTKTEGNKIPKNTLHTKINEKTWASTLTHAPTRSHTHQKRGGNLSLFMNK